MLSVASQSGNKLSPSAIQIGMGFRISPSPGNPVAAEIAGWKGWGEGLFRLKVARERTPNALTLTLSRSTGRGDNAAAIESCIAVLFSGEINLADGEFSLPVHFKNLRDIHILPAIGIEEWNGFPYRLMQFAAAKMTTLALPQINCLAEGKLNHGEHGFGQFQNAQRIARGNRSHADFILVVRFGAAAENTGGHGELQ
jgi:hypothetical protein